MSSKIDTLNSELQKLEAEKKMFDVNNDLKKNQLISELKLGLGEQIKKNPSKFKIIKKTRKERFILWLKKIFTKF
jgi:hypothetical protein